MITSKEQLNERLNDQIGFLQPLRGKFRVIGNCCVQKFIPSLETPIFRVNIFPYRQTCFECGARLVNPATDSWPELF